MYQKQETVKEQNVGSPQEGNILQSTQDGESDTQNPVSKFFPVLVVIGIVVAALAVTATVQLCKWGAKQRQRVDQTNGGHGQERRMNRFDYVHSVL